ncbi:hypothetical protein [Deinococcus yavapaiensis]|uniref:Uncharacterized protein n=1 Tax=Deinococcus yavapaiensis KR-236 TaxID=694435 RepID=A0A318S330_9DEIO|nr:hypothetical protein [Deinococcus yavapaiensis]PYE50497.1 hypothetical protein DES52_11715 [Deinococcus yavapaiensis KR-236]
MLQQKKTIEDLTYLVPGVQGMLDELAWWATVLKTARNPTAQPTT